MEPWKSAGRLPVFREPGHVLREPVGVRGLTNSWFPEYHRPVHRVKVNGPRVSLPLT